MRITVLSLLCSISFFSCGNGNKKDEQKKNADTAATVQTQSTHLITAPKTDQDTSKNGEYTLRYPNGVIQMKGFYVNGKREGECASFFQNGKTQSEGYFKNGLREGTGIVYYENGQKMYEGSYKAGVMSGKWRYYNPDGKFNKEVDYDKENNKK